MQLRQLRYIVEVHQRGNHISAAAQALNTSQPSMSKQIQELEAELGFAIFERSRNRVVGLTEPGREVIEIAQRILNEVASLRTVREDFQAREEGKLTIATTHTHARYILPSVIEKFVKKHPLVRIALQQGNPAEICEAVASGVADFAVGTAPMQRLPSLLMVPWCEITRSLIAPKNHPILRLKEITLEAIAQYPLIAYDPHRSGRWNIFDAFDRKGIKPSILFDAVDADVSKTYVELGLGIAILATPAVDPAHDRDLRARDVSHLFESSISYVTIRRKTYMRRFIFDFFSLLSPKLTAEFLRAQLRSEP